MKASIRIPRVIIFLIVMSSLTIPYCSCFLSLLQPSLPHFLTSFLDRERGERGERGGGGGVKGGEIDGERSLPLYISLKLFDSIISTLQRSFSRALSTYSLRTRCFASSWLPGSTRAQEFLIKFHSFLARLFLGFLNRTLIARESRWLLPSSATRHRSFVRVFSLPLSPPVARSLNWRIIM